MNLIFTLAVLFFLYQIPALNVFLRWAILLIILGLLLRYSSKVFDDVKTAFN